MFKKISNKIFAVDRSFQIAADRFNHCSTICPHRNGVLVAWYSGSGECQNDQSVHVVFIDGHAPESDTLQLDVVRTVDLTGNPVLWADGDDAMLLMSRFEDTGDVSKIVDRWKYCSLWIQRLTCNDKIEFLGEPVKIADPDQHLLGRCNPIQIGDELLLPLYDEMTGECVIFAGSGTEFKERGRFGHDMIQPTLWKHTEDGETKLYSLSRNFSRTGNKSFFCESTNNGVAWSEPVPSSLYNRNNSLHVLHWNDNNVVLWNDTPGPRRDSMTMGILSEQIQYPGFKEIQASSVSIVGLRYGSYPSMCVDAIGNLNFTFTNAKRTIDYHIWNSKAFSQRRDHTNRLRAAKDNDQKS